MPTYSRTTVIDSAPGGDSVKQAVLDLDTDLTNSFTHLNTLDTGKEPTLTGATADTATADADTVYGGNAGSSFATIKTTWTTIKAFLKTYFDAIYSPIAGPGSSQAFTTGALTVGTSGKLTPTNLGYGATYKVMSFYQAGNYSVALNTDPVVITGGSFAGDGSEIFIRDSTKFSIPNAGGTDWTAPLILSNTGIDVNGTISGTLATYANEAAAVTAGLTTGTLYKTATGEVRVKL